MWAGWKFSSVASKSTKYRLLDASGTCEAGSRTQTAARLSLDSLESLESLEPVSSIVSWEAPLRRHQPSRATDITGVPGSEWSAHHETDVQPTGSGSGIGEGHFGCQAD